MPERVRRHSLAPGDARGARVAEERLGHDRLREAAALHADEERRLGVMRPHTQVVDEERLERWVKRHGALAATLRSAHLEQAALQVDVRPAEPEQLAATEARGGFLCLGEARLARRGALARSLASLPRGSYRLRQSISPA